MISAKTYNLKGEALKDTTLPEGVFGVKVKPILLAQAVRIYLANQRSASATTKTRGDVSKTTAKMFKQKGTGRARHGSYAAPIFVGGGISHGPTGEQNYHLNFSGTMKRQALLGALSVKAAKGEIQIISGAADATGKTQESAQLWTKLDNKGKVLVVTSKELANFNRATRNLDRVQMAHANQINTYEILAHKHLILTKEAVAELQKHYAN